jgi:solute carrier family 25 iron transporter 28/37
MQVFSTQPAAMYTGMTQAFGKVVSTEGASRLWRGVWSVILGAGPAHAVYFGTYEAVKDFAGGNRAGHQITATGTSLYPFLSFVVRGFLACQREKINRVHFD